MFCAESKIENYLKDYLRTKLKVEWIGQSATLSELGLDSISLTELIVSLEKTLNISIPMAVGYQNSDIHDLIEKLESLFQTTHGEQVEIEKIRQYKSYINPHLARKLEQLKIDRTFVRAHGSTLVDENGRSYIDFMSQYGALPFGHHPPQIWDAIRQLETEQEPIFIQPSFLDAAGRLAEKLISLGPKGLRYVTFSNSGAEAVEVALKIARSVTGRIGIISAKKSFHGKTMAALSATGNIDYQKPFGLPLTGFKHVEYGNIQSLERLLLTRPNYFAAFIVEPIQGEGGVTVPPLGYLGEAKKLCHKYGVLLIVDEVQTGLGRTGELFACQEDNICPDIMILAKALGGGIVPIGATLCTEAAYSEKFALKHSSTFAGNALAARAGLATLELLTKDDNALIKHVREESEYLKARLLNLQKQFPWLIKEICGRGFMLGIKFTSERSYWQENFLGIAAEQKELAQFIASYLLNVEGVRLAPTLNGSDVLRIQPPLNISHNECTIVINAIERTVKQLASKKINLFYKGILAKTEIALSDERLEQSANPPRIVRNLSDKRFAFLLHPLDEFSYADYDPHLKQLTNQELLEFADSMDGLMDPVIGSTARIQSLDGSCAVGDFIMISHTAQQLKNMSANDALNVMRKGLELAKKRGANIVGLGAYTSVVSGGGKLLTDMNIPLTSGNSYTVVSGIEALDSAVKLLDKDWKKMTASVLGANGAIGSCMAALLSERVSRLIMIGNSAHSLEVSRTKLVETARTLISRVKSNDPSLNTIPAESLAGEIQKLLCEDLPSDEDLIKMLESSGRIILTTNVRTLALADIVVTATSQPNQCIYDEILKSEAIICDISRPRSIEKSILIKRPDVLVIDGGIIALPGRPRIGPYGIPDGSSYACMAETILLTLDGHFEHTSLGNRLNMDEIIWLKNLAKKHGFTNDGLQSFGKVLSSEELNLYKKNKILT